MTNTTTMNKMIEPSPIITKISTVKLVLDVVCLILFAAVRGGLEQLSLKYTGLLFVPQNEVACTLKKNIKKITTVK